MADSSSWQSFSQDPLYRQVNGPWIKNFQGDRLSGDPFSFLEPATAQRGAAARGFHAGPKSNFLFATTNVGVIRRFHKARSVAKKSALHAFVKTASKASISWRNRAEISTTRNALSTAYINGMDIAYVGTVLTFPTGLL